jgi:hypothetical protein
MLKIQHDARNLTPAQEPVKQDADFLASIEIDCKQFIL